MINSSAVMISRTAVHYAGEFHYNDTDMSSDRTLDSLFHSQVITFAGIWIGVRLSFGVRFSVAF